MYGIKIKTLCVNCGHFKIQYGDCTGQNPQEIAPNAFSFCLMCIDKGYDNIDQNIVYGSSGHFNIQDGGRMAQISIFSWAYFLEYTLFYPCAKNSCSLYVLTDLSSDILTHYSKFALLSKTEDFPYLRGRRNSIYSCDLNISPTCLQVGLKCSSDSQAVFKNNKYVHVRMIFKQ